MDAFRFILENPHPNASANKQRKRARLVTACDSCRVKKIKCLQPVPNGRCDACRIAKTPCLFGDRDRYQAERGVACTWHSPVEDGPAATPPASRKRKRSPVPYPTPSASPRPAARASPSVQSRSATPARRSVPDDRSAEPLPLRPEQCHADPSVGHETGLAPPRAHGSPACYGEVPWFDPNRPRFPHPYRMRRLAALFFDSLGAVFPFLDRRDVLHRIERQTCSAILSNCIAALALRAGSQHPRDPAAAARVPFYDMAASLASYVVSVPSVEALHALICLTWAEYGAGREDGFWMYSRMAIAMCLDLGLGCEATIQVAASPEVRHRLRLTWWTVVCTADIAAAWVTGRAAMLDLAQYDTQLPEATDDASLLFRNTAALYVLRGRLNRVLDAHVDNRGDSSLDWDLSTLQTDVEAMSGALPATLVFSGDNLAGMRDRGLGHLFVQMHVLMQAVSALLSRPSLLPRYGLPVPTEGPRAEAAQCRAKCVADILMTVERVAPGMLCDPFLDLPILVACVTFIADGAVPGSPRSSMMPARQWSETCLGRCKEFLARLSATWGGAGTFDAVLEQRAGMVEEAQMPSFFSSSSSSNDSQQWLVLPNLLDDETSDSSRSSPRELSPLLAPSTTEGPKYHPFDVGGSPLVHEADDSGLELNTREAAFYPLDLVMPSLAGSLGMGPGEDVFDGVAGYFEEQVSLDSAEAHRLLNVQVWREDSSLQGDLSPLEWASQYVT